MGARDDLGVFVVLFGSHSKPINDPPVITHSNLKQPPHTRYTNPTQFDPILRNPFRLSVCIVHNNSTALHALIMTTILSMMSESRVVEQTLEVGKIGLATVRADHFCYGWGGDGRVADEEQFGSMRLRTSTRGARFACP